MPRKKKRVVANFIFGQPGIARTHVEAHYSSLPKSKEGLKNGHVLFLFISLCNKSRPETEKRLNSHFSLSDSAGIDLSVQVLVSKTLLRFKNLSDPKEFQLFTNICDGTFNLPESGPSSSTRRTKAINYPPQCSRPLEDTIASMTPTQKTKKVASSLPCEVFFACTRCGSRSRTVPQLHTHYRTVHKEEIANGSLTTKDPEDSSQRDGDIESLRNKTSKTGGDSIRSKVSDKIITDKGREKLNPVGHGHDKKESLSDVMYVEGSKTPAKSASPGPVINHPEKDCVITRKRNVPLGMLEGKKNSLMVIFQHSDQNKPLPQGSSFKLRNAGGEQTYMVVANVDVDIIEQGKPAKKVKSGKC